MFLGLRDSEPGIPKEMEEYTTDAQNSIRDLPKLLKTLKSRDGFEDDLHWVNHHLIGNYSSFQGPFGSRRCIYMDHTASGRSVQFIEEFIYRNVLPVYANTHTTISYTSSQTTSLRNEARDVIRECVNASKEDVVLFTGSGATAAVHKLVHMVQIKGDPTPIVFIGPFEHHSSILPWRDMGGLIINIPENDYGTLDIKFLKKKLESIASKRENKGRLLIGVFSATSNVTGALTDDIAVTVLLHQYGGFVFWDYAAAAPHVKIDMNPSVNEDDNYALYESLARKDAIYFSGHKFVGGPQTPGVLIVKNHVFRNDLPHNGGGGSVFFVTPERHQYLQDKTEKEEGGTPAIIESIRLGLVMTFKESVGVENIIAREAFFTKRALDRWKKIPELMILGNPYSVRGPIISFLVIHLQTGYFLHQNFVVALLNDLFGIQCRGGCMCAGPYSQTLLGINLKVAQKYEDLLSQDSRYFRDPFGNHKCGEPEYDLIFKPGFTRISLPFHASIEEVDFAIDAVEMVARLGWQLLPLYSFIPQDSKFFYCHLYQSNGVLKDKLLNGSSKRDYASFPECLHQAQYLMHNNQTVMKAFYLKDDTKKFNPSFHPLRWFLLPSEALEILKNSPKIKLIKSPTPFSPKYNVYKNLKTHNLSPGSIPYAIVHNSCWNHTNEETCQYSQKVLLTSSMRKTKNRNEKDMWKITKTIQDSEPVKLHKSQSLNFKDSLKENLGVSKNPGGGLSFVSKEENRYRSHLSVSCSPSPVQNLKHRIQRSNSCKDNEMEHLSSGYHSEEAVNLGSHLLSEQSVLIERNLARVLKDQLDQMRLDMRATVDEIAVELRNEIRNIMPFSQDSLLAPNRMRHDNCSDSGSNF